MGAGGGVRVTALTEGAAFALALGADGAGCLAFGSIAGRATRAGPVLASSRFGGVTVAGGVV